MASTSNTILLASLLLLLLQTNAQTTPSAPAPAGPAGPVNLTAILEKNGQFTTFLRLLNTTQVGNQIPIQLNSSSEGMTVFAPTDNAFQNLKSGALNDLSVQQQVQLVLYHVAPKFYSLSSLLLVPNPVRTQATGQDGGAYGLNFTGQGNQVNVSTGVVDTPINNPLAQTFPLAVYQVDKVLLPEELFGTPAPGAAPGARPRGVSGGGDTDSTVDSQPAGPTAAPNGAGGRNLGRGFGLGMLCFLGALF
ncbi:unnamed protein product [Linum tenue]|uniref:FAS1 domain-containing protein n=1 Tax=Linum tenue TaxID=586396 RepID=A0AAV0HJH9_9ROSI|nr:unnamed protein product [Linum tenue]